MGWCVYILECKDGTLYTGISTDIDRRLHEHNHTKKAAKYTRARRPVKLVYCQAFANRRDAVKEEYRIKKLNVISKNKLIKENNV